jgi:hypothetical protein
MKRLPLILALMLAGCQIQIPLGEDTNQPLETGSGDPPQVSAASPRHGLELPDEDPETPGISGAFTLDFSDHMDEVRLTPANVELVNVVTNTAFTGARMIYNPVLRRLYLRSEDWVQGSVYMLRMATGAVRNKLGVQLDGNGNGRVDAAPYDDYITGFYVNSGNPALVPFRTPPRIDRVRPDSVGYDSLQPLIAVDFSYAMVDSTLRNPDGSPKGIRLIRESDSAAMPLRMVSLSNASIAVIPQESLRLGEFYRVALACSTIRGRYSTTTPDFMRYLDGDRDGPEAEEPDFTWRFWLDSIIPPRVRSAELIPGGFAVNFDKVMDTASINPATIQGWDDEGYVPSRLFKTDYDFGGTLLTRIEYYYARPVPDEQILVRVSRHVRDVKGRKLDSNENRVGGEPADYFEIELPEE